MTDWAYADAPQKKARNLNGRNSPDASRGTAVVSSIPPLQ